MIHESKGNEDMSPQEVNCPRWLQKRMRANLAIAAKEKVSRKRAKIARAILETTKAKAPAQVPAAVAETGSPAPLVETIQPAQPAAHAGRWRIWHRAKVNFRKLAHDICSLLPAKRFLRPAHQDRVSRVSKSKKLF
jgi:hypothetical protein